MKPHTKIYMAFFDYGIEDFVQCEVCGCKAVDVHHIENRKSGGDPNGLKDAIDNLMGLCRKCHDKYGDVPMLRDMLKKIHLKFMEKYDKKHT